MKVRLKINSRSALQGVMLAVMAFGVAVPVSAKPPKARPVPIPVLEVWPGQRVILLLPLELGAGWNVDPVFGKAILHDAEENLRNVLQNSGKLSVIEPHRFNPIFTRAVQDKRITSQQMSDLVENPTLENARMVLAKMDSSFDQPPLIGQFSLEEVRVDSNKDAGIQVQVSARLYELGGVGPDKTSVVTSDTVGGSARTSQKVVGAATNAFGTAIAEFVKPIDEFILPANVAAPAADAASSVPTAPAMPAPAPNGVVLPGDVPIAGSSTRHRKGAAAAQPPAMGATTASH